MLYIFTPYIVYIIPHVVIRVVLEAPRGVFKGMAKGLRGRSYRGKKGGASELV